MHDFLVVGAGLTGATIARRLADAGRRVIVVERRPHVGGNCADAVHECGLRYHLHGPHYFRTSSDRIWSFVRRFARFLPFEATIKTQAPDGEIVAWPIHAEYIRRRGLHMPEDGGSAGNFEQSCLRMMPEEIYRDFVRGYTAKQWGCDPAGLDAGLCRRFDVRDDGDERLSRATYQGIPENGYTQMVERMLGRITTVTATEDRPAAAFTVYTGPIDAWFGHDLGRLRYRTQHRMIRQSRARLPAVQVNNPNESTGSIRTVDWSYLPGQPSTRGTILTDEYPADASVDDECEYPFPDAENQRLYASYRQRADKIKNVLICGRLGEYRYLDMDQAIGRAMTLADNLL